MSTTGDSSKLPREVREGDQSKSSSPSSKVMRELKGDPSTVPPDKPALQLARKISQDVLRPKTPEGSEEQEIRKLNAHEAREATKTLERASQEFGFTKGIRDPLMVNKAMPPCIRELFDHTADSGHGHKVSINAFRKALDKSDSFLSDWEQVEPVLNEFSKIRQAEKAP